MKTKLVFLISALASTNASAQFYGAIGWAGVDSNRPTFSQSGVVDLGEAPTGGNSGTDSLPLSVGYQFNKWLAVEGNYLDAKGIHKTSNTVRTSADPLSRGTATREWDYRSIGLSVVGSVPFGNFSAFGKASANHVDGKFRSSTVITRSDLTPPQVLVNTQTSASNDAWIPSFGLGVQYNFKPIGVRLMYERFADKSGLFGAGNDLEGVRALSLQVMAFF